jgi:tRNA threonylcarbamoyladenosine biosynthesis protein TsaE
MEVVVETLEDTKGVAETFLESLTLEDRAAVVGLSGELGAGKTAFVKLCAGLLGIQEEITSPTFVLLKRYPLRKNSFSNLIHIDAYRLERGEDLLKLRWGDYVRERTNLIFIEWPEHISDILPKDMHHITFIVMDKERRLITIDDD